MTSPHQFVPPLKLISSAVVQGNGTLLLTFADGSTLNAGTVVGPTGAAAAGVLSLAVADAVPAGTPVGTIIVRS